MNATKRVPGILIVSLIGCALLMAVWLSAPPPAGGQTGGSPGSKPAEDAAPPLPAGGQLWDTPHLPAKWRRPAEPKIVLWAAPGELQIDPLTGRSPNPFVRDRDWAKGNSIWSSDDKTVRLSGARNEWLGWQLIVQASGEDLRYVNVQAGDLTGPGGKIPAGNIKLFRVWYTEVTEPSRTFEGGFNALGVPSLGPGWYGDALIPFGTRYWSNPFAVPEGRNQSVYADVLVPKGTPAGVYRGAVKATADRAKPAEVNVELTVWDFDVPDKLNVRAEAPFYRGTIPGGFGLNERDDRALKLERQFFRMARAHRFSAYIYDTWPDVVAGGDEGELKLDWTFYDKRFAGCLDGSAFDDKLPMDQWYVAIDCGWPSPRDWQDKKPDVYHARIEQAIRSYDRHFAEKKWNPTHMYVFFQGLDEPSSQDKFDKIKKIADAVHRGSKRIKMRHDFYTAFARPERMTQFFGDTIDIWNISGCFYPVKLLQEQQAQGRQAWFYQGAEPWIGGEDLDNDLLGLRTWAWIGWKYRVDCWHNWCSGRWSSENILTTANNANSREAWRPNGNGVMIYPGAPLGVEDLLPSLRLKAYRRGNTDFEYLFLLKQLGAGDEADRIVGTIIRKALGEAGNDEKLIGNFGDWSHDADQWEKARAELAKAILAAKAKK